ncbi:MAG: universal stress protein, partial [Winogradskyella sp.]|nr:universal stress protein [Winogradskyella sp.]
SDNAFNAISFALEFFKYDTTEFYFMHAYEDEVYEDEELLNEKTLDEVIELLHNQTLLKLESLIKRLNKIAPNPRYSFFTISAFNSLIDEVDKIVLEKNIDLVVMGTKGATADRNVSFGSNTLHVLKYVQCPVLAIPSNYEYTQPKKILFPSNFLIPYKRRELKLLCTLAKPYRSKIELLYISDTMNLSRRQKANKEFIEDELKSNKVTFNVVSGKSKTKVIQNSIKTNNIDMLTMVNTRHSFLEDLLFPSTIEKISLSIDKPLLALQNIRRYD